MFYKRRGKEKNRCFRLLFRSVRSDKLYQSNCLDLEHISFSKLMKFVYCKRKTVFSSVFFLLVMVWLIHGLFSWDEDAGLLWFILDSHTVSVLLCLPYTPWVFPPWKPALCQHCYLCCLNYKLDEQPVTLFQYYYIKPSGFWLIT